MLCFIALLPFVRIDNFGTAYAQEVTAAEVKGAYLINFLKFVEFSTEQSTRTICIVETPEILRGVTSREIGTIHVEVIHLGAHESVPSCSIVYLPRDQLRWLTSTGKGNQNALLVGEGEQFLSQGGMIRFFVEEARVRFEVKIAAVERAGLKISSRLLALARVQ